MSRALQSALNYLGSLQPGDNPWPFVRGILWETIVPRVSPSVEYQLYVLSVILGICLVFVLLSLVVRVYTDSFWIVRLGGWDVLWRPHWSISWSLWAVILCALLQGQIWSSVTYIDRKQTVNGYIAWRVFPWIAAWLGGWTATWSLLVSYIAHLESNGRVGVSRRVCLTLNLGAILVPLFYIACLLPFAIHSCRRYDEFIGDFDVLLLALNDLDRNFSGSASILDVADKIPLVTALNDASNALLGSLRQTFIVLAASGVFLFFALVSVASIHLRSLGRVLKESTSLAATLQSSSSQEMQLRRSFSNLKWTVISFTCIDTCFTAICMHVACDTRGAFTQALPMHIEILAPLYIFSAFGLPTAFLLFRRSLDSLSTSTGPKLGFGHKTTTTTISINGASSQSRPHNPPPPGFVFPLSPEELYEMGRRTDTGGAGEKMDEEKRDVGAGGDNETFPPPAAACRPRGGTVVRSPDGWFRSPADDVELPPLSLKTDYDSSAASYSTAQTERLEGGLLDGDEQRRKRRRSDLWRFSIGRGGGTDKESA